MKRKRKVRFNEVRRGTVYSLLFKMKRQAAGKQQCNNIIEPDETKMKGRKRIKNNNHFKIKAYLFVFSEIDPS